MDPKYSIVCAAYNVEKYIDEAIASVLGQTETSWELIVIDDGSTDGTANCVRRYRDDRIKLIQQTNAGPSAARNTGISASRGARLLLLDSDDRLHPTTLAHLGAALDARGAIASYGQCCVISEDGQLIGQLYRSRRGYPPSGDVLSFLMMSNLFANGGHVCIDATVARALGGLRTDLSVGEDHEYWCRLAAQGPIVYVGDDPPVLDYRWRPNSVYREKGRDPAYQALVIDAIFGNPELIGRFSAHQLRRLRRSAEATASWMIAREYIRFGDWATARRFLAKSLLKKLDYKRAAVLFFALFGGAPAFLERRVLDLRKYEFPIGGPASAARDRQSPVGLPPELGGVDDARYRNEQRDALKL